MTKTIDDEIADDVDNHTAQPDQLTKIVGAGNRLRGVTRTIADLEARLEAAKAEKLQLEQEVLPALMEEAGIKDLGLEGDDRLVSEIKVFSSINQDNMDKAVAWLDRHNFGSIVKSQVVIPVDREDPQGRAKIMQLLAKARIVHALKSSIHPQTLGAFARESVEVGRKLPSYISVHTQPVVSIKAPRKTKSRSK